MTAINLVDYRRMKGVIERYLRTQYAIELATMPAGAAESYLADESARYALAFLRVAKPRWSDER